MKARDLKGMPKAELIAKLNELKKELVKHNAQIATGTTPKSPGQVKQTKKTIAKILTLIKQGGR
jgi:large subunit ribosomal protein L29